MKKTMKSLPHWAASLALVLIVLLSATSLNAATLEGIMRALQERGAVVNEINNVSGEYINWHAEIGGILPTSITVPAYPEDGFILAQYDPESEPPIEDIVGIVKAINNNLRDLYPMYVIHDPALPQSQYTGLDNFPQHLDRDNLPVSGNISEINYMVALNNIAAAVCEMNAIWGWLEVTQGSDRLKQGYDGASGEGQHCNPGFWYDYTETVDPYTTQTVVFQYYNGIGFEHCEFIGDLYGNCFDEEQFETNSEIFKSTREYQRESVGFSKSVLYIDPVPYPPQIRDFRRIQAGG